MDTNLNPAKNNSDNLPPGNTLRDIMTEAIAWIGWQDTYFSPHSKHWNDKKSKYKTLRDYLDSLCDDDFLSYYNEIKRYLDVID